MALKYYSDSALTNEITNLTTEHETIGGVEEKQIFIGNTDVNFYYEDIVINIEDTATPPDEKTWIQLALDNAGAPSTYGSAGASLTFPNITDNLAHSFWIKVTTPDLGTAQNKTDLRLNTTFKEFAV
jgi:hypothetical protein